jgi:hypothetical protein
MWKTIFDNANPPKEFYEIKKCHCCGPRYFAEEISEKIYDLMKVREYIKTDSNED